MFIILSKTIICFWVELRNIRIIGVIFQFYYSLLSFFKKIILFLFRFSYQKGNSVPAFIRELFDKPMCVCEKKRAEIYLIKTKNEVTVL